MQIHSFIFNWRGQYEKTKQKEQQFKDLGLKLTIINSDEAHDDEGWVNVGESAYFTDQMLTAIELLDGDVLFHVQADASYDKWREVIDAAKQSFYKYNWGIYAPNIDYTWYDASRTDVATISNGEQNLRLVACPDCTCWFIHRDIINDFHDRRINMEPYKMGWGWDIIFPALSFLRRRPVIRDYAFTVDHPPGTAYNKNQAEQEMHDLFASLPDDLKQLFYYIKASRHQILNYFERK